MFVCRQDMFPLSLIRVCTPPRSSGVAHPALFEPLAVAQDFGHELCPEAKIIGQLHLPPDCETDPLISRLFFTPPFTLGACVYLPDNNVLWLRRLPHEPCVRVLYAGALFCLSWMCAPCARIPEPYHMCPLPKFRATPWAQHSVIRNTLALCYNCVASGHSTSQN